MTCAMEGGRITSEALANKWVREVSNPETACRLRASARLLAEARVLLEFRNVFALRTAVLRGRLRPRWKTPEAFARFVGGGISRPKTPVARRREALRASDPLPDPLAHLVCQFWLGVPPRRANRAS